MRVDSADNDDNDDNAAPFYLKSREYSVSIRIF